MGNCVSESGTAQHMETQINANGCHPNIESGLGCQGRFFLQVLNFLANLSIAHRYACGWIFFTSCSSSINEIILVDPKHLEHTNGLTL